MKILIIDVNCKGSSTGKIVYDLYNSLNKKGDTAAICYGRGPKVEGKNIFKFGLDSETNLHALLARLTGYNGCFSHFSTQRLIKYIDDFKPDLIHIHELHAYFVNVVQLLEYIKIKKIPVVWTFHCEYMYTGKCGYAYDCEKWKKECGHCPAVKEYPKSLLFDNTREMFRRKKKVMQDLDLTIVTPSKWLADRVEQSFLKNKPIIVIHNGIDSDNIFYPRTREEISALKKKYNLDERKIVLSVAPNIMEERKGGKKVLEIAAQMTNYQFVLVGTKENTIYGENVILIQRTSDQNELAVWYSMADLFLICSNKENFPTTCLEALSCGTPIVGLDEGGTKETAPTPYGLFSENSSTEELIKMIFVQLNIEFSREEIRSKAIELYSQEVMCENYSKLYDSVCNTSHFIERKAIK